MKVVIVDDEYNSIENLRTHLEDYTELEIISTFTDPVKALAFLIRNEADLLFLDIEMPNISGLYIAEQITLLHPDTKICFITAHAEGAIKAFELNALDYIQKPFSSERLRHCMNKIQNEPALRKPDYDSLSHEIEYPLNIICGYHDEDIILINAEDIFYFETIRGNVYIHTKDNVYRGNKPLGFYEEKLKPLYFFKTHKCYLVNLSKVDHFSPRISYTYDIFFKGIKDVIPLSRNNVKALKAQLQ
ncbi:MAG: LytTR family DNA-binding domain-containing protein [Lachnospiraceae bacterium]|nr:LytTR family DNA-binding domain-containing protein [Lachnospiraceae bacterium]